MGMTSDNTGEIIIHFSVQKYKYISVLILVLGNFTFKILLPLCSNVVFEILQGVSAKMLFYILYQFSDRFCSVTVITNVTMKFHNRGSFAYRIISEMFEIYNNM